MRRGHERKTARRRRREVVLRGIRFRWEEREAGTNIGARAEEPSGIGETARHRGCALRREHTGLPSISRAGCAIDPEGLRLTGKGRRKPEVALRWLDLLSGEAALAVALNASLSREAPPARQAPEEQPADRAPRKAPRKGVG